MPDPKTQLEADANDRKESLLKFEKNMFELVVDSQMVFDVIARLPYLNEKGRIQIGKAYNALLQIPEEDAIHRSSLVYRGILDLLIFSNILRDVLGDVKLDEEKSIWILRAYCGLDVQLVIRKIPDVSRFLERAFVSLSQAGSDEEARLLKNVGITLSRIQVVNRAYSLNEAQATIVELVERTAKQSFCR